MPSFYFFFAEYIRARKIMGIRRNPGSSWRITGTDILFTSLKKINKLEILMIYHTLALVASSS